MPPRKRKSEKVEESSIDQPTSAPSTTSTSTLAAPPIVAVAPTKKRPTKRARLDVRPEETTQVTNLDEFKLDLADAEVFYLPFVEDEEEANRWYKELLELDTWYHPKLKVYGREVQQSRKIAAYSTDPEMTVKYSGHDVELHTDYPPVLKAIQDRLEERLQTTFNHCMLNLYENGTIYIGKHADNRENRNFFPCSSKVKTSLTGENEIRVIASVSVGAPRTFILAHRAAKGTSDPRYYRKWQLANGSLVVMQGATQKLWKHEIPKEPAIKQGRISLTFRQLVF